MDDMYMVFVELPKFKASTWHDRKMAVLWLRFLTEIDEHTKEIPSELAADELVAKALSLVEESAYTDAELLAIDKYWDQVSRERTALNAAERKGRAEGEAIGIEKRNLQIAQQMKADGMPIDVIVKYSNLSVEQIERL